MDFWSRVVINIRYSDILVATEGGAPKRIAPAKGYTAHFLAAKANVDVAGSQSIIFTASRRGPRRDGYPCCSLATKICFIVCMSSQCGWVHRRVCRRLPLYIADQIFVRISSVVYAAWSAIGFDTPLLVDRPIDIPNGKADIFCRISKFNRYLNVRGCAGLIIHGQLQRILTRRPSLQASRIDRWRTAQPSCRTRLRERNGYCSGVVRIRYRACGRGSPGPSPSRVPIEHISVRWSRESRKCQTDAKCEECFQMKNVD